MKQQVLFKLDEGNRNHPFGQETVFEPQRGIIRIELEEGYAQVTLVTENVSQLLKLFSDIDSSFSYLKLLADGISFIITEEEEKNWSFYEVIKGLSIMKIHATNLREEHGLVAHVLEIVTHMDLEINHISDLHNCLTLVLNKKDAEQICQEILKNEFKD